MKYFFFPLVCFPLFLLGQPKPLDHSVYDNWKSAGERAISPDGKFVAYAITPQEGDALLTVAAPGREFKKEIPRGTDARFSADSRYLVFKVKPFFKETREARIKKKKNDEMPKDSLGILELASGNLIAFPRIKAYKMPEKGSGRWLAYLSEKTLPEPSKTEPHPDSLTQLNRLSRMADSLTRMADSIRNKLQRVREQGLSVLLDTAAVARKNNKSNESTYEEGTDLWLYDLQNGTSKRIPLVSEFLFSENGAALLVATTRSKKDTAAQASILLMNTETGTLSTVLKKYNEARGLALDRTGRQAAFVAERDSSAKALQKFFQLFYYKQGMDSAEKIGFRQSGWMPQGMTISPDHNNQFSENGQRLYFGIAPVRKPKDTTLVDFETARLDIWHYNDDYLQPQQQVELMAKLKSSYASVWEVGSSRPIILGGEDSENIQWGDQGNADWVLATSTQNNRIASQWQGFAWQNAFLVSVKDGSRRTIANGQRGSFSFSPKARFVYWYDWAKRHYYTYDVEKAKIVMASKGVPHPLWDEEDDHPDDPPPYGIASWTENDKQLIVYDRYDLWALDPGGAKAPEVLTKGAGRKVHIELRYLRLDPEEQFIRQGQEMLFKAFDPESKYGGFYKMAFDGHSLPIKITLTPHSYPSVVRATKAGRYLVQRASIASSELFWGDELSALQPLTAIADQQKPYEWLKVELVKWKMFDGRMSEGLLYKPEHFDPSKKYPLIFYFYERDADGLYNYRAPAPSASTINIPYFVSNGYLVFDPNIYYKNGEPGGSAYNSVVSAAKYLSKMPWVDSTRLGIQGQSWGGYQVAYIITRTNMFAAAGAGAPVANMTSAYGGIRWGSGLNRQFQYERTQSRLGATLWQRPDLYLKNSPLFQADKIKTPLLMTHNDKDGAVPWYQGIEFFTALRRLGKQVWLLQYNDEDHNLVERRNRKDLSQRLSQFFDHYLKDAPMTTWLKQGVPAELKGIEWGLDLRSEK